MNLLLAIFYSNFVSQFETKVDNREEERTDYLKKKFDKLRGQKSYLNIQETHAMFVIIHNLVKQSSETDEQLDELVELDMSQQNLGDDNEQSIKLKKKSIAFKQFEHIWKFKIQSKLEDEDKF